MSYFSKWNHSFQNDLIDPYQIILVQPTAKLVFTSKKDSLSAGFHLYNYFHSRVRMGLGRLFMWYYLLPSPSSHWGLTVHITAWLYTLYTCTLLYSCSLNINNARMIKWCSQLVDIKDDIIINQRIFSYLALTHKQNYWVPSNSYVTPH